MRFKELAERDITEVFENPEEFAEEVTVEYNHRKFKCVAVLDTDTEDRADREIQYIKGKRSDLGSYGMYQCDLLMYIKADRMPDTPVQNTRISVNGERYTIVSISRMAGEYVLGMQRFAN